MCEKRLQTPFSWLFDACLAPSASENSRKYYGSGCQVEHEKILAILNRHPVERTNFLKLVEEHLDKQAASRVIHHQLFSAFSAQFRTLIGVNCERRLYFPRETIVREGATGDKMYIMNLGSASVKVTKQSVMQIRGGSHFGFNMICSDKVHTCSSHLFR